MTISNTELPGNEGSTSVPATSEIVSALIAYAGPADDPRIGWVGQNSSSHNLYSCERCGKEHEDCTKIEHEHGCSAAGLIAVMRTIDAALKATP